jgi:hypothetical protein
MAHKLDSASFELPYVFARISLLLFCSGTYAAKLQKTVDAHFFLSIFIMTCLLVIR